LTDRLGVGGKLRRRNDGHAFKEVTEKELADVSKGAERNGAGKNIRTFLRGSLWGSGDTNGGWVSARPQGVVQISIGRGISLIFAL